MQLEFSNESTGVSCPTEVEFRDRVVASLGFDPFVAGAPRALVIALKDRDKRVVAQVALYDRAGKVPLGKRELSAIRGECAELGDSMAIAVSLIIDPLGLAHKAAVAAAAKQEPKAVAPREPPTVLVVHESPEQVTPSPPAPVSGAPLRPLLDVAPQLSFGRGPGATLGGRLGVAAAITRWSIGIEGAIESTAGFRPVIGDELRMLFASAGVTACYRRPFFEGCGVASIAIARGELRDVALTLRTLASWTGIRLGVPIGIGAHVFAVPWVDLLANVVRTRVDVDGAQAWMAPPFAITFGVALRLAP